MSNDDLIAQFKRCEKWQDAEQWDLLAMAYYNRGYELNARCLFQRADTCRLKETADVMALDAVESV